MSRSIRSVRNSTSLTRERCLIPLFSIPLPQIPRLTPRPVTTAKHLDSSKERAPAGYERYGFRLRLIRIGFLCRLTSASQPPLQPLLPLKHFLGLPASTR